jgi:hypothetical protein
MADTPSSAARSGGRFDADAEFDRIWTVADQVGGWLTRDQAHLLWEAALRLPEGALIVEIGSHQGRSTAVLGRAAQLVGARLVAIDPFVEGRLFGGSATRRRFENTVRTAGLSDVVELQVDRSTALRPGWTRPVNLLYIDGKHDYWTVSDDLRWTTFQREGSEVLIHDCYSSIGVTLGVLLRVLPGSRLVYRERSGSLARFEVGPPATADRMRIVGELPGFLRNVLIKILLRLRLRPVAARLGHDGPYDPY